VEEQSKTLEIIRRIGAPEPEKIAVSGILRSPELALLMLALPADSGSSLAGFLSLLGEHGINIRFITKYDDQTGTMLLNLAVEKDSLPRSLELARSHGPSLGLRTLSHRPDVLIISIYPYKGRALVAERLMTSLRMGGIEPLAINNASSVISCVITSGDLQSALACLENTFKLP
jgi:aspartokinase